MDDCVFCATFDGNSLEDCKKSNRCEPVIKSVRIVDDISDYAGKSFDSLITVYRDPIEFKKHIREKIQRKLHVIFRRHWYEKCQKISHNWMGF